MPEFAYIARDTTGGKVTGTVSAQSEREALSNLAGRDLFPVEVNEQKQRSLPLIGGRVKGQTMATLYGQMAALLRSGVPLLRTITVLRDQASNRKLKETLSEVYGRVEDGETLADAMSRHPAVFSDMAINMTRAGGEGGFMEEALERVAQFTEDQEDLKSRTIGALAYPGFLAVVGTLVVTGLVVFVVPKFSAIFEGLRNRGELPIFTDMLLGFSNTLQDQGLWILGGIAIVVFVVYTRLQTEQGRRLADLLKLRIPLFGRVFKNFAVARFCRVLGTLLRNGVPILKSLDISSDAAGNRILSEAIEDATENIMSGESLAVPLSASGHFPATVVEMIAVAEESNTLDSVLVEIADNLEKRTTRALDLAVKLLEPMMLLLMAGVVLFVVVALLLPMIKMSTMFG